VGRLRGPLEKLREFEEGFYEKKIKIELKLEIQSVRFFPQN